jgi:hypothetical protein
MQRRFHTLLLIGLIAATIFTLGGAKPAYAADLQSCELYYSHDAHSSGSNPCVALSELYANSHSSRGHLGCDLKDIIDLINFSPAACHVGQAWDSRKNPEENTGVQVILFQSESTHMSTSSFRNISSDNVDGVLSTSAERTIREPIHINLKEERSNSYWRGHTGEAILVSGVAPIYPDDCYAESGSLRSCSWNQDYLFASWVTDLLQRTMQTTKSDLKFGKSEYHRNSVALIDPDNMGDGYEVRLDVELDEEQYDDSDAAFVISGKGIIIFQDINFVLKRGKLLEITEGSDVRIYFDRSNIKTQNSWNSEALIVSERLSDVRFSNANEPQRFDGACPSSGCNYKPEDYLRSRNWHGPTTLRRHGTAPLILARQATYDERFLTGLKIKGIESNPSPLLAVEGETHGINCERRANDWCLLDEMPANINRISDREELVAVCNDMESCELIERRVIDGAESTVLLLDGWDPEHHVLIDDMGRTIIVNTMACPNGKPMQLGEDAERCQIENGRFDTEGGTVVCDTGYTIEDGTCVETTCPESYHFDSESENFCKLNQGMEVGAVGDRVWTECPGEAIPDGIGEPVIDNEDTYEERWAHCICPDQEEPVIAWRRGKSRCLSEASENDGEDEEASEPDSNDENDPTSETEDEVTEESDSTTDVEISSSESACELDGGEWNPLMAECSLSDAESEIDIDDNNADGVVSGCSMIDSKSENASPFYLLAMLATIIAALRFQKSRSDRSTNSRA